MSDPNVPPSPPGGTPPGGDPPPPPGGGAPPPPGGGAPPPPPAGGAPPPPPGGGAPPPSAGPPADSNRTVMLILAYLWVLALVPYLAEKHDPEVKWHARHGLVLLAAEVVLWVVLTLISTLPVVGCLIAPLWFVIALAAIVVRILAISKALNGERFLIPGVSQYADQVP